MSIEGGGIGGGVGAVASVGSGIEGGGVAGAASISGLARFDKGLAFGAAPVVAGPVNEGPVGLAALRLTVPISEYSENSVSQSVSKPENQIVRIVEADVLAEAESILSQAQESAIFSPVIPANAGIQLSEQIKSDDKKMEPVILPQVEPVVVPFPVPDNLEFPQPQVGVSPAVKPLVQPEVKPIVLTQPALKEQVIQEKAVSEREVEKQIDRGKEEEEEVKFKNVVDEKVLETRLAEFGSAAEIVAAAADNNLEEINGKEIVGQVPVETEEKRSGLVKKSGPDGSREETMEEAGSRKFKSIKEAREQIAAIIFNKPPVKKGKEGQEVGQEAVARVLKYRRENTLEDLGLSELFSKSSTTF